MEQLLIFLLGERFYGFDISDITEVLKVQEVSEVPLSNRNVLGIIDIRGKISTVLSLESILEISVKEKAQDFIIVNNKENKQFIFPVTKVLNIKHLKENEFLKKQERSVISSKNIKGYVKYEDNIVIVLNLNCLNEDMDEVFLLETKGNSI